MAKITLKEIEETLSPLNWKCLSTKYTNLDSEMEFQCPDNHKVFNTWRKLRNKQVCPTCERNSLLLKQDITVRPRKNTKDYRILALDQSSQLTGWCCYDNQTLRGYGVFKAKGKNPLERIIELCDWIIFMIQTWNPDEVALEEPQYNAKAEQGYYGDNYHTFRLLNKVVGAAMLTVAREHIKVTCVEISAWRGYCKIGARTRVDQKRNAQILVSQWYDIKVGDDEAEAICIGKYLSDKHKQDNEVIIGEWTI